MNRWCQQAMLILFCLGPTPAWSEPLSNMSAIPSGMLESSFSKKPITIAAFWIDRYEVTQKQYKQIMGENPSFFKGKNRPVEKVTWDQANAYCFKVDKRLPTEWEWEYAARAGTSSAYYWGNAMDDAYVWNKGNSNKQTHPVGKKKPNAFGLYDMSGNVWEWTASDHEKGGKVQRGGSWRNNAISHRSGHRILSNPIYRYHYVGFRCARSVKP